MALLLKKKLKMEGYYMRKEIYIICFVLGLFIFTSCDKNNNSEKNTQHTTDIKIVKVYKLAIIDAQEGEPYKSARENMLITLKSNGYEEGKNLQVFYESIGNDVNKGKKILKEMIGKEPDIIFANGTVITKAVKESEYFNNPKYKFVYACVTDPVGLGVIENIGTTPIYNLTGVSYPVPIDSRLKFVKDLIPTVKRIALIHSDMPQSISYKKWVEEALKTVPELKGVEVIFKSVHLISGEDGSKKMAVIAKKICNRTG